MFIDVAEIPPEGLTLRGSSGSLVEVDFAGRDISPLTTLSVKEFELRVTLDGEEVTVAGSATMSYAFLCDRCGKEVQKEDVFPVMELLENIGSELPAERELAREELEIAFFDGDGFHLEDILLEQVLLSLPQKRLCSEECRGLCVRCGHDLNEGDCGCDRSVVDPRFEVLKQLLENKE